MGFTVEYSAAELTQKAGFGRVAHLPFLMNSYAHYHDRGSEYLIDRGLGYWSPVTGLQGRRRRPPTPKSIENYASWLANFLHWAEAGKRDPLEMDYWEDLYEDYQGDMQSGAWSRHGKPLKPNTFNARVDTACDYLRWLSAKGFRDEFYVPTEMRKVPSYGSEGSGSKRKKEVEVRQGKVPAPMEDLVMPLSQDVRRWLESVGVTSGATLQLVCETIVRTALRLSEVVGLRADFLPENRKDWRVVNPDAPVHKQEVSLKIKFGVKGPFYGWDHGDRIGPEQTIRVPLDLAIKWDRYRKEKQYRPKSLVLWVGEADTAKEKRKRIGESVHLFLNEKTGKLLTQDNVYRAWKNREGYSPFPEWRPHMGRHWWACSTLSQEVEKLEVIKKLGPEASVQMVRDVSLQIIELRIRPQLRHLDKAMTHRYLVWVTSQYSSPIELEYDALISASESQA